LERHLQTATAGTQQYVALSGPAGIGKSALLTEFTLLRCLAPHIQLVQVNLGECLLVQEFYTRLFESLRARSSKILQTLYNDTKGLRKALAVTWDETEFCNILTSTDWAPLHEPTAGRGRRMDPLAQLFAVVAQHPWAIGAAVTLDCLNREASRSGTQNRWIQLWNTLLRTIRVRGLLPGAVLVLGIDQVETPLLARGDFGEQWERHWQTFMQTIAQENVPCLVLWAGTEAGILPVRHAMPRARQLIEHSIGPLADEEMQALLPRLGRGLPRLLRAPWEQLVTTAESQLHSPAHLLLVATVMAVLAAGQQVDASLLRTVLAQKPTALVQRLVDTVQQRQPDAREFLQQLLALLAFFPPGKEFVLDDIFPLCDLDALALDVVRGRTMLESLLGECVRCGLLGYEAYTSRYRVGNSLILQGLQKLLYATPEEQRTVAVRRRLAAAVLHHMQYGELELLQILGRIVATVASEETAAPLAPYLLTPLRRILGQSTKAERQRVAEALGNFPSPLAVDLLLLLLNDEEGQVRSRAVQSLAELEGIDTLEALLLALKDSNSDVRWIAACTLGKMAGASTVDALIAVLSDEDKEVGRIAAEGLGQKGDRRAVPHLIAAMRDSYPLLRESAALALGRLADKRALPALQELLQDTNLQVRRSAATALNQLLPSSS
jgi:HEAT repeat protein